MGDFVDKIEIETGHRWLMPIILATQEAEIQEDHGSKPANSL
jgi:hypothetical protein